MATKNQKKWAQYQAQSYRGKKVNLPQVTRLHLSIGLVTVFFVILFLALHFSYKSNARPEKKQMIAIDNENIKPFKTLPVNSPQQQLAFIKTVQNLSRVSEDTQPSFDEKPLTIDLELQHYVASLLKRYQPKLGAVVVSRPQTGEILAMVDFSDGGSANYYLPLSNSFPAASIFKLVTASAALQYAQVSPQTPLRSVGNPYRLPESKLKEKSLRRGIQVTFENALAKSYNVAFADLTKRYLDFQSLRRTASQFGYNREIPFLFNLPQSEVSLDDEDEFALAKTSTGLSDNSLSPLHAVIMANAIANRGIGWAPKIFSDGVFTDKPFIQLPQQTADVLSQMMEKTITQGTSRKSFRGIFQNPRFRGSVVAGKTGTLSCHNLGGDCDWFVGFTKGHTGGETLSVAVVLVHGPYWQVKSSYLARRIFEHYVVPTQTGERTLQQAKI